MKVLIGCEFSGTVRDAFTRRGHDAWSCDLLPTEKKGQHYTSDIFQALEKQKWDIVILHPPCTCLSLSGNSTYGFGMPKHRARIDSLIWTKRLWETAKQNAKSVALENPANVLASTIGKKTQTIQPYQFGHMEQKQTWLWLHNLPPLKITNDVKSEMMKLPKNQRERIHYLPPSADRWKIRSITFTGIAEAMAEQWGIKIEPTEQQTKLL